MPKLLILCLLAILATAAPAPAQTSFTFDTTPDRVWIGRDFWANRLQDWRITNGRVECIETRKNMPMRTAQLLTHSLSDTQGKAEISVRLGPIDPAATQGWPRPGRDRTITDETPTPLGSDADTEAALAAEVSDQTCTNIGQPDPTLRRLSVGVRNMAPVLRNPVP